MKTASIPSLRVAPELREAAEDLLREGETLSGFLEESLRAHIQRRRTQQEFITRGLASRDEAKQSGTYFSADQVLREMKSKLAKKKAKSQ
ncbi:MAG: YlcI/YnfO family protein [Pseudomonadota bacterium]